MKKLLMTVALLFGSLLATGQTIQPFVAGGGQLNGAGYSTVGAVAAGGFIVDSKHLFLSPEVGYTTGGKADDADNTSSSGHTRYFNAFALAKVGRFGFGPGFAWSKLYTPDYDKSGWHPKAAFSYDFASDYISKLIVAYVGKGNDQTNGVQGIEAEAFWFIGKHVFVRADVQGDWGHETVIPVSQGGSLSSVASENAQKITTSQFQMVLGYRF
jgi:hypothetical protein